MKKIFTLAIMALSSLIVFANHDDGRMSITNLGGRDTWLELDGKRYSDRDNPVLIRELASGNHTVKIYRENTPKSVWDRVGMGRKPEIIYSNTIYIKPRYHVDIVINRFGKVMVDEQSMTDRNYDDDKDGGDYRRDDNWNNAAMSNRSFNGLMNTLRKEPFDDNRMNMIKQSIMDNNYFTVDQVKQLATLFTFDDKRLEVAKYAYRNTVNKGDYVQLYEVFTFNRSKDELADYIRRSR